MGENQNFNIAPVRTVSDLEAVRELFRAYAASLAVDLAYQNFADELASLPGKYAPPRGMLLLARTHAGVPMACVALRPMIVSECAEMKRLYVKPAGRGLGLGRSMVETIVSEARRLGHREIRLDTLPSMSEAIALYRKCGFEPIVPYYDTPVAGTLFLGRQV